MGKSVLKVAPAGRSLQTRDAKPFFWLGDTCWAAPARARWEEWERYVRTRSRQGFSVLQLNSLPQFDSVQPTWESRYPFGLKPDGYWDFSKPQNEYFEFLRRMVQFANEQGLVVAIVLLWFNYVPNARLWTVPAPRSQATLHEAKAYAAFLSELLGGLDVVWILTGDDTYLGDGVVEYTREIGRSLRETDPDKRLITIHPSRIAGPWFHGEPWLDIEMVQSSHFDAYLNLAYELPRLEWARQPAKPIVNGEICYEGYPGFDWGHRFDRCDVRKAFWWSVLEGAFGGITYGADGIWPWAREGDSAPGAAPVPALTWRQALDLPGAADLVRSKDLLVEVGWWKLRPAPQRLLDVPARHVPVADTPDGNLLLAYLPKMPPTCAAIELETTGLARDAVASWWFPQNGERQVLGPITKGRVRLAAPEGGDSVLIISTGGNA